MNVGIPPQRWRDDFLKWVAGYRFDRHNDPSPRAVVALGLIWSHYASNDGTDSYPGYRWLRSITSLRPDEITRVREFLIVHGWLADDGHGPHGSNRVLLTNVSEGRQSSPAEPSSEVQQSSPADRSEGREHPASEVRQSSPAEGRSEGRSEVRQSSPEPPTSDRKGGGGGEPHDTTATPSVGGNTTTKEEEDEDDRVVAWSNAEVDTFLTRCGVDQYGDTRVAARKAFAAGYTIEHAPQIAKKLETMNSPNGGFIKFVARGHDPDDWLPSTITPTVSYSNPGGTIDAEGRPPKFDPDGQLPRMTPVAVWREFSAPKWWVERDHIEPHPSHFTYEFLRNWFADRWTDHRDFTPMFGQAEDHSGLSKGWGTFTDFGNHLAAVDLLLFIEGQSDSGTMPWSPALGPMASELFDHFNRGGFAPDPDDDPPPEIYDDHIRPVLTAAGVLLVAAEEERWDRLSEDAGFLDDYQTPLRLLAHYELGGRYAIRQ